MSKPPIALEARKSEEARLFSPSAGRNKADIAAALADILPIGTTVLEIGLSLIHISEPTRPY